MLVLTGRDFGSKVEDLDVTNVTIGGRPCEIVRATSGSNDTPMD